MKKAIVTGYNSGIGEAICRELEMNSYSIIKLKTRLEDIKSLETEVKDILKSNEIDLLVNCAGFGIFEPHEEISISLIEKLIDVNLKAPIVLTNLCLRSLKKTKGNIINISSIEAMRSSKFSGLYSATKSGLRSFSLALFEEVRKSGVGVTSINPDLTDTNFFNDLRFKPSKKEAYHLEVETIAKSVMEILNTKGVITDVTIRPQYFGIEKR